VLIAETVIFGGWVINEHSFHLAFENKKAAGS
jgi:hypothetical protein